MEGRALEGCRECRGRRPVVLRFLTHEEAGDEAAKGAKMPYPCVCPHCGRQVVRLVREYIGVREANI